MDATITARCPRCRTNALVEHAGAVHRCVACSFDYGTLRADEAAREAWMLEGLRGGPAEKLAVLFLHRRVMDLPIADSNQRVMALADRHGVVSGTPERSGKVLAIGLSIALVAFAVVLTLVLR